jgi:hypothetical protein
MRAIGQEIIGTGLGCFFGGVLLLAWMTHVIVCLTDGRWGFLIAGALFFPIAIIHGVGIWLGVWS